MEDGDSCENVLDIDRGHITKSPCKDCPEKNRLPACSENCQRLALLQDLLSGTVSCSNYVSEREEYVTSIDG